MASKSKYRGRTIRVATALIQRGDEVLISRRPAEAVLGGLWEFPGGRIPDGAEDSPTLAEKLQSRFGIRASVGTLNMEVVHHYEHYVVHLSVYHATLMEPLPDDPRLRFVAPDELPEYEFPGADQETIDLLLSSEESEAG